MQPVTIDTTIAIFSLWKAAGLKPPEAWRGAQGEAEAAVVWADTLSDTTHAQAMDAARRVMRRGGQFFPTVGDLCEAIRETAAVVAMTGDEAWTHVAMMVRRHGSWHPPVRPGQPVGRDEWRLHDDPATEADLWTALESVGGWSGRCAMLTEDVAPNRASFRQVFDAAARRSRVRAESSVVAMIEGRAGSLALSMDEQPDNVCRLPVRR